MWWKIKPDLWDFFSHWVTDSDCAENLLIGERLSSPPFDSRQGYPYPRETFKRELVGWFLLDEHDWVRKSN